MAPKLPPDYEAYEQAAWLESARNVRARLATPDPYILKRIETFGRRFEYAPQTVAKKILEDEMFAAHFAIEPRRTGLHERIAAEWLRKIPEIRKFKSLPKSGKNAVYITSDGEIRSGVKNPPSKSLDFQWHTGDTACYAAHKYTRESGGNQDSQYKEMVQLLRQFQNCAQRNCTLIVIVDGPYYTEAKMENLKNRTRDHPPRSHAVHIEEVPEVLKDYADDAD